MNRANEETTLTEAKMSTRCAAWIGLAEYLKKPEIKIDIVPILDLLVIALLVSLLFTRFVMLPGVQVDLPVTGLRMPHTASAVSVLTIENKGMLFYEGNIHGIDTIERAFRIYVENAKKNDSVLLIKSQADIDLETFLNLCRMAQEAGFAQVQIAGKKNERSTKLPALDRLQDRSTGNLPIL